MAEQNSYQAVEIAAGRKLRAATVNRCRTAFSSTPATHSIVSGDTVGTGEIIPKGSRLLPGAVISCATGTASSTLSVGIRDAVTKVAIDATAIINAQAINAAGVFTPNNGTKVNAGQDYTLAADAEIYWTVAGANFASNQQVSVTVPYMTA